MKLWLRDIWQRSLAYWRLDLGLVCELSRGLPEDADYHDFPDSLLGHPWHFYTHTCRRCGKQFTI